MSLPSALDLTYLTEVDRTHNLSRAAERLGISQPTLSLAIQKLERNLGTQLLIRHKTGVELTPSGVRVVKRSRELLSLWQQVAHDALADETQIQGQFVVGCHSSVARYALPSVMRKLLHDQEHLHFSLIHDLSRKIAEGVISHRIDIGIVINPVAHPDLVIVPLGKDSVRLYENKKSRASAVLFCDPELTQVRNILPKLEKKHLRFTQIIPSSNLEVIAKLVSEGAGFGLLPDRVAALEGNRDLAPVDLSLPEFSDRICLIFRRDAMRTAASKYVLSAFKKAAQSWTDPN